MRHSWAGAAIPRRTQQAYLKASNTGTNHAFGKSVFVVRTDDGLKAFCLYASPDQESVLARAAAMGLPVERCLEVETDLAP